MNSINENVIISGAVKELSVPALIDTGAEISLIPIQLAIEIGVWHTEYVKSIRGIHNTVEELPIVTTSLYFPRLNGIGGRFFFVMSNKVPKFIVGMDILKPLGITIDTKPGKLGVKNEIWEAFKTLSAAGVITWGVWQGVKLFNDLTQEK